MYMMQLVDEFPKRERTARASGGRLVFEQLLRTPTKTVRLEFSGPGQAKGAASSLYKIGADIGRKVKVCVRKEGPMNHAVYVAFKSNNNTEE